MAAGDLPIYTAIPLCTLYNPRQVFRAINEAAAGAGVQILNFDDSQGTFSAGQGGNYHVALNAILAARFGPSTFSEWLKAGSYGSSNNVNGMGSLRAGSFLAAAYYSGDTGTAGTSGFLTADLHLPGLPTNGMQQGATFITTNYLNGVMANTRQRLSGGRYMTRSTATITLDLMALNWVGGTITTPDPDITATIEAQMDRLDALYPINPSNSSAGGTYQSYSGWASSSGYPATETTAFGVATAANGQVMQQSHSLTLTGSDPYPVFGFYHSNNTRVWPITAFRYRDPAVNNRGVVASFFGVGGRYFDEYFGASGAHKNSAPVLQALCNSVDTTWIMVGAHTNYFGGSSTALQTSDYCVTGVGWLLDNMPSSKRAKAMIILCSDDYRRGGGYNTTEFNQHVGGLCRAAQIISGSYNVGVAVLNTYLGMERLGFSADYEDIDLATITVTWDSVTTYARGDRVKTNGSLGVECWESTRDGNLNVEPGTQNSLGHWIPIRTHLYNPQSGFDDVHHSPLGGYRKAQIIDSALFGGPYYTASINGSSITTTLINLNGESRIRNRGI